MNLRGAPVDSARHFIRGAQDRPGPEGSISRMARYRQGPRGARALRSLWARAGERAGNGAGALFARLDAQDARDAAESQAAIGAPQDFRPELQVAQAREQAAATLERLAARIRLGAWNADLAALTERAARLEREAQR